MRKEIDVVIEDEGRDKGKRFHIKEMGAEPAEWWAMRAILALGRADPSINFEPGMGMQALAAIGVRAFFRLHPEDLRPLMDEMFACISIKPDPKRPKYDRSLLPEDIEEVQTRVKLRAEVFALHTGFSFPGGRSA